MSDEEEFDSERYDSDVEDDGKVSENDAGKRAYHNLLERKRRDNIKDSFSQLRDVLPYFSKKKKVRASRVQILKKSCDFIKQQKSLQDYREEMASLEEENKLLEESLAELDGAVRDNDVESVAKITSITLPLKRRHYFLENEETDSEEGESSDEDDDGSSPSPPIATSSPRRKTKRI